MMQAPPRTELRRLKILMSAYACEPGKGSEPGVGWNLAKAVAAQHDVWVLTRANNRGAIEAELRERRVPGLRFVYYDLPRWAAWWKRGGRGVQLYYYLWQLGAIAVARAVHRTVGFDVAHHVTFVKYWAPAAAAFVGVPFVWGPVGGGESMPRQFLTALTPAGRRYEALRSVARWMGERDLWVRATTRRAALAFATTPESAERMRRVGARRVEMLSAVALTNDERSCLATLARSKGPEVLFFSAGRLIDWKGYHLSLEAFAAADLPDARYVVAGDGPARDHLEALADRFGLRDRVKFLGAVPRAKVLEWLGRVSVFVHPSLHDSGGWATIEAMAAGVPVICLNLGGPGKQVTEDVGRRLHASSVDATTGALAEAMRELGMDAKLRAELGAGARKRVVEVYTWDTKVAVLSKAYAHAIAEPSPGLG
jgi:glycosyltransferase involved in cell wall biosynthesis